MAMTGPSWPTRRCQCLCGCTAAIPYWQGLCKHCWGGCPVPGCRCVPRGPHCPARGCCGLTVFDVMNCFLAEARLVDDTWQGQFIGLPPVGHQPPPLRASRIWYAIQLVQQWQRRQGFGSLRATIRRRLLWVVWSAWEMECPWYGQLRQADRHALIFSLHDWWLDSVEPAHCGCVVSLSRTTASAGAVVADRWRLLPSWEWRAAVFEDLSP